MPTAATVTQGGTAQGTSARGTQAPVLPVVPFVRASAEHREPAGIDVSRLATAADQDLGVFDIPAYGYVRSVLLVVQGSGAVGAAVGSADSPWNALKNIALTEPNGAVIHQFNSGYSLYLANKWGGYRHPVGSDLRASPIYSYVSTLGNFTFIVRIPVEINLRDALGSLPNQNAAATFKLRATLAANAGYTTAPATTQATVRVRAYIEAWDQPSTSDAGQTNQVTPPAMNTTQFWSEQTYNYNAGAQNIRLTRVGNYIRNLILIARQTASGTRASGDTDFPDPASLYLDARPLDIIERNNWKHQMFERSGYGGAVGTSVPANDQPGGLDAGVFVYDFCHEFDGGLGRENRDLWLPTLGSTRLELQGSFAAAGTLTVLTNDVAIAGGVFL